MEIFDWDVAAAGNGFAAPDGFPEGMNYSQVNNAAREIMAVLVRAYKDTSGESLTAGTGAAYTLASNRTLAGYVNGLTYRFRAHATNTGAATLNIASQGAVPITLSDGTALTVGEVKIGGIYEVTYSSVLAGFALNGGVAKATDVIRGTVELASNAEAEAGTSTAHAVTPANLAGMGVWKDTRYFESAEQTPVASTLYTIAHGLGVAPKFVELMAVCKTAEGGYATNDVVHMGSYFNIFDGTGEYRVPMVSDATNVKFKTSGALQFPRFDTTAHFTMTPANWKFKVRAFA